MMEAIHGKEQKICQRTLIEMTYQLWDFLVLILKSQKTMAHLVMEKLFLWMSHPYGTTLFGLVLMMEMFKYQKTAAKIGLKSVETFTIYQVDLM